MRRSLNWADIALRDWGELPGLVSDPNPISGNVEASSVAVDML
jgi:hypothetical protein